MNKKSLQKAIRQVPSPSYLVDLAALEANCQKLDIIQTRTGCRILLALKGFAMFSTFGLLRKYLHGVCASGIHEARLGKEEFGKSVHAYSPAFALNELIEILPHLNYLTLNSYNQWQLFQTLQLPWSNGHVGFRVNPEYSEAPAEIYDPCASGSRLGIRANDLINKNLEGISGIHFHTLCEQNSDALSNTVKALEGKFKWYLERSEVTWINMGGGHHITRKNYDVDLLCRVISQTAERYALQVYLEPGEAVAFHCGYLVSSVLDIVNNELPIAILDASATAHMPDVLEMPYKPEVIDGGAPGEKLYTYRLGGPTCLAGDVIGDFSFDEPLKIGQRLVFLDMGHYTMVKTNTFNGVNLPAIATFHQDDDAIRLVKEFGYENYRNRLS